MRRIGLQVFIAIFLSLGIVFSGCNRKPNRTVKGGAIGAGSGAVVGGVIGKVAGNTAAGVIVGAAVGGAAGAAIGNYMDRQAREIQEDLEGAKVERIGEGIKITFPAGILFDVNSYSVKPGAKIDLLKLSQTLKKYDDTEILVQGHTDNVGTDEYNQKLSQQRADAVAYIIGQNDVELNRLKIEGLGESAPIAENKTVEGKQKNRRVEIAIFANDKLKKAAKRGDIQ